MQSGLKTVASDADRDQPATDETDASRRESPPSAPAVAAGRMRIAADMQTELRRHGIEPERVLPTRLYLPRRLFLFPRVRPDDDTARYHRRVNRLAVFVQTAALVFLCFLFAATAAILFSVNELVIKPGAREAHVNQLEDKYRTIVANTHLGIEPVEPVLPGWLWSSFTPDWYIEDAVYSRTLDLADEDVELLSFLREKKAVIAREIEPAYSNDKIQNRLRDPQIIYFGSDYERAYRRFVNTVLAISALAREDNPVPGLDAIYTPKRREELVARITRPQPPEPNPYYDSRVVAILDELRADRPLVNSEGALLADDEREMAVFVELLDDIRRDMPETEFAALGSEGAGPVLRHLPYGWGSTNLTRTFYEAKRQRFINWSILELRLLMLDLLYRAEELPQELALDHLYLYFAGGESFQQIYARHASRNLVNEAKSWIESDVSQENNPADREQRFIDAFIDNAAITESTEGTEGTETNPRVVLSLVYKAARFEHVYERVDNAAEDLAARPFLGKMGLPVASIDPDDIKPWGLFNARRNGYSHEGLDVGGELGDPALAVMDGTVVRAGYQRGGAGNYLVLSQGNMEVTYMHLLKEPSRSNYERLLTRDEIREFGNDSARGYERALRRYASLVLRKSMDALTAEELNPAYLRERSFFDRNLVAVRRGEKPKVRQGDAIANIGLSGNVTLNSARPEMIYPHVHLEINDGRIDPMQVIPAIGSRWFEIRDHHLNHPFYRNWLKQSHNWSWYSKFYPNGAVPDDARSG